MAQRATDPDQPPEARSKRLDRREFLVAGGALTAATALGAGALTSATSPAPARAAKIGAYRRSSQPNILVIMVDELRTPCWFGAGRGAAPVLPPAIAGLEQAGASFRRHYTASNDCTPARSAMVTGLYTHQTGCMITGTSTLNPAFPTWGKMLRNHGYGTWWFGKWHLAADDRWWTPADGPAALERYGFAGGTFPSPNGAPGQGWTADRLIADQFGRWIDTTAAGAGPWCTTVSFVNPHDIAWWWRWSSRYPNEVSAPSVVSALPPNFETPTEFEERRKPRVQRSLMDVADASFGSVPFSGPAVAETWLPFMDLYVKVTRAVDDHIAAVLAALARRPNVANNTVVVFTSDHGEYGGSHGLRGKGAGVYDEAIRVPLIVTDFSNTLGVTPGLRDQLTSSVDLAPMLLTIANGSNDWRTDPGYAQIAGRADLLAIASDPGAPGRDYALHATDEVVTEFALLPHDAGAPLHISAVITPTHKYATYSHWHPGTLHPIVATQEVELYDHTTADGRLELTNQSGTSPNEDGLGRTLAQAVTAELRGPLPPHLADAHHLGISEYHAIASRERAISEVYRLNAVEQIVRRFESQLP
jgi:arylsulfatase A-like enzyme